jgi:hypothetical protein
MATSMRLMAPEAPSPLPCQEGKEEHDAQDRPAEVGWTYGFSGRLKIDFRV